MVEPSESLFAIDRLPAYKDQCKGMSSHQSFVYKLGLELCMNYVTKDEKIAEMYDQEFVHDLHARNTVFDLPKLKCRLCPFKTESKLVLDSHMTEPHHFATSYICNFCPDFKTKSKEKYLEHLLDEHNRVAKMDKPFINSSIMCPVCDYETAISTATPKLCDIDKTQIHIEHHCPFRDKNNEVNPVLKIDYKHILNNNLSPSQFDLIDYEFMFNKKPNDTYVNKYSLFSACLLKTNSALASSALQEEAFVVQQTKLLESFLPNNKVLIQKENKAQKSSAQQQPIITSSTKINQIPVTNNIKIAPQNNNIPKINVLNSKPVHTISYSNNPIKCDLCTVFFSGTFALVNYEAHLKTVHSLRNVQDLRACLSKCFRPVEQKSSPQSIKVIKLNQNLVLVRKNPNEVKQVTPVIKRPIEVIDLENEDDNTKKFKTNENNELLIQVKLKEIDTEKKFIFSLLKIQKNDSDLVELKGIQGTCYICKFQFQNILSHLHTEHQLDASKSLQLNRCILCGSVYEDKNDLIRHQYDKHSLITFSSLNKIFTLDSANVKKIDSSTNLDQKEAPKDDDCIALDDDTSVKEPIINLKIDSKSEEKISDKDKNIKKCVKCSKKFESFSKLLYHVKNEHGHLQNKKAVDSDRESLGNGELKVDNVKENDEVKIRTDSDKKKETEVAEELKNISDLPKKIEKITCKFCDYSDMDNYSDYETHLSDVHMKRCQIRLRKLSDNDEALRTKLTELKNKKELSTLFIKSEEMSPDDSNLRRRSRRLRK